MARRPRRGGVPLWRRAVLADMRAVQAAFPTVALAERIEHTSAGGEVVVSAGRLFRGLLPIAPETADLFRYHRETGETWFTLTVDDTLIET